MWKDTNIDNRISLWTQKLCAICSRFTFFELKKKSWHMTQWGFVVHSKIHSKIHSKLAILYCPEPCPAQSEHEIWLNLKIAVQLGTKTNKWLNIYFYFIIFIIKITPTGNWFRQSTWEEKFWKGRRDFGGNMVKDSNWWACSWCKSSPPWQRGKVEAVDAEWDRSLILKVLQQWSWQANFH